MQELNMMLADLAGEGDVESSGVFTLSLEKAGEKLAAYRLLNPGLFVLNLVAAAVCAEAREFRIETRESQTAFFYDSNVDFSDPELERLFAYILEPSAPAYLRELALAVHGAMSLPEKPVLRLHLVGPRTCREMVISEGSIALNPASMGPMGITVRIEYPQVGGWTRLFDNRVARRAEPLNHLFHFCRYAPMTIINNGKAQGSRVTGGIYDQSVFAWRYLKGVQPLRVVNPERRFDLTLSQRTESPIASSVVLSFLADVDAKNEGLLLISRGVAFRRPSFVLGFSMAQAVVTADHLEKNLSQSDLVEGPEFEELMAVLRGEVESLILEVCSNPPPGWSVATSNAFGRQLEARYRDVEEVPMPVQMFRRLQTMEAECSTTEGQERQVEFWRELSAGDVAAGKRYGRDLAKFFRATAGRRLASGVWLDAQRCLHHLAQIEGRPDDGLRLVAMVMGGQGESARALAEANPQMPGYTPMLAYMLGWTDRLESQHPMGTFLHFQRCMEEGRSEEARGVAAALEAVDGSAILYLWLGWYAISLGDYGRAARQWERCLGRLSVEERERWANILWPDLTGKVSFLEQVRWQARRGLDELQMSLNQRRQSGYASSQTTHPARWARGVWRALIEGQSRTAREAFLNGYLTSLIRIHELELEPLTSSAGPLAPFR